MRKPIHHRKRTLTVRNRTTSLLLERMESRRLYAADLLPGLSVEPDSSQCASATDTPGELTIECVTIEIATDDANETKPAAADSGFDVCQADSSTAFDDVYRQSSDEILMIDVGVLELDRSEYSAGCGALVHTGTDVSPPDRGFGNSSPVDNSMSSSAAAELGRDDAQPTGRLGDSGSDGLYVARIDAQVAAGLFPVEALLPSRPMPNLLIAATGIDGNRLASDRYRVASRLDTSRTAAQDVARLFSDQLVTPLSNNSFPLAIDKLQDFTVDNTRDRLQLTQQTTTGERPPSEYAGKATTVPDEFVRRPVPDQAVGSGGRDGLNVTAADESSEATLIAMQEFDDEITTETGVRESRELIERAPWHDSVWVSCLLPVVADAVLYYRATWQVESETTRSSEPPKFPRSRC